LSVEDRIDYRTRASILAVFTGDARAQIDCAVVLVDALGGETMEMDKAAKLELLIRRHPTMANSAKRKLSVHIAASRIRQSDLESERYMNMKERLLCDAIALYKQAGDHLAEQRAAEMLAEIYRRDGFTREHMAESRSGLLIRAKELEQAAQAYGGYWPQDADRCRSAAHKYRSDAESAATTVAGYADARTRLDAGLRGVPQERASARSPFLLGRPYIKDGKVQNATLVISQRSIGWLDDRNDDVINSIGALVGIDVNVPVLKWWLWNVVTSLGDSDSYCPAPDMMPIWIVTTTWRKTLLAMLIAALSGNVAGYAAGGLDPKAALAGAVGTETAMLVNLLSTYITKPNRKELSDLLRTHDTEEAAILIHLWGKTLSCAELAKECQLSPAAVRKILKDLESKRVIQRVETGSHRAQPALASPAR
jgi:hypothetical protein